MITEQYVTFKTARLLKEVGFNAHCSFIIDDDGNKLYRPTQELAARWIFEMHGMFIEDYILINGKFSYRLFIKGRCNIADRHKIYDTIQECLEEALQEALRLIIKTKKMNKETIQSKALEFASLRYGNSGNETGNEIAKVQACAVGFRKGAGWRINSVWHDKNEMPEREELVLCEIHRKKQKAYLILQCNADGETDVEIPFWDLDGYKLIRWAYIDDLIPDRKEAEK